MIAIRQHFRMHEGSRFKTLDVKQKVNASDQWYRKRRRAMAVVCAICSSQEADRTEYPCVFLLSPVCQSFFLLVSDCIYMHTVVASGYGKLFREDMLQFSSPPGAAFSPSRLFATTFSWRLCNRPLEGAYVCTAIVGSTWLLCLGS